MQLSTTTLLPVVVARQSAKSTRYGPLACDFSPPDPRQQELNGTGFGRPTGPAQLQVHSQLQPSRRQEWIHVSLAWTLAIGRAQLGGVKCAGNRLAILPSSLHGPGSVSRLTEVSEALALLACLLDGDLASAASEAKGKRKVMAAEVDDADLQ